MLLRLFVLYRVGYYFLPPLVSFGFVCGRSICLSGCGVNWCMAAFPGPWHLMCWWCPQSCFARGLSFSCGNCGVSLFAGFFSACMFGLTILCYSCWAAGRLSGHLCGFRVCPWFALLASFRPIFRPAFSYAACISFLLRLGALCISPCSLLFI